MYEFGFIGFGSMATMLIDGFIRYAGVSASNIIVTRNDKNRLSQISEAFPGIHTANTVPEVVCNAKRVLICVKPVEVKSVLLEMKPYISGDAHIISLAGMVSLNNILSIVDCKVSKLIPTAVSETGEGISLVCYSSGVAESDRISFEQYIKKLGKVKVIDEKDIAFAAELTSCNPGFIASILDNMTRAAAFHTTSFSMEEIAEMVTYTAYTTTKLLFEKKWNHNTLIKRVATKGGITEEGVAVFNEMLPDVFQAVFSKTLGKRAAVEKRINDDFPEQK